MMAFKAKQKACALSSETKILTFTLAEGWIPACAGMTAALKRLNA